MSADHDIDRWLAEEGYSLPEARAKARAALEAAQLTRPGKRRISDEKAPRMTAVLSERFFRHCGSPECESFARASGRLPVLSPKSSCQRCVGSDNRRAEVSLLEACQAKSVRKIVIVGGSPAVREELGSQLGSALELRMVDGTERRTSDRAKSDLEWADLVLVWGASELHHKVSTLYTQVAPPLRKKVVHVAKRGVAALLAAAVEHLNRA